MKSQLGHSNAEERVLGNFTEENESSFTPHSSLQRLHIQRSCVRIITFVNLFLNK
jgi:hypothetical protein